MKLTDHVDLATAQAYEVTVDTKQVGSGQARGYLVNTNDLWKVLKLTQADITHPLFSLADAIITTASDAQSYFGMDETKAEGIANRFGLSVLVSQGIMTQVEADGFIDKTLSKSKPHKNATQADWDKAQLELSQTKVETSYVSADYILNKYRKTVAVSVTIDTPVPYDDVITFKCQSGTTVTDAQGVVTTTYSDNDVQRAAIVIPANYVGTKDTKLNVSGLQVKVKGFGTSRFNRVFTSAIFNPVDA